MKADLLQLLCLLPVLLMIGAAFVRMPDAWRSALLGTYVGGLLLIAIQAFSAPISWQMPSWICFGGAPVQFSCDQVSGLFLVILSVVAVGSLIYTPSYLSHLSERIHKNLYWTALTLFLAAMAGVICASNALAFLVFWELMSLSSAVLVASDYKQQEAQRAAIIYLIATRLSSAFLCAGFFVLYSQFHSFDFAAWSFTGLEGIVAASLLLIGLAIKAGIWPFHVWLPYAHAQAPSPVSALMSGVMVKLSAYAAIRFFLFGGLLSLPLSITLSVICCISALWGLVFALNQRELKRTLAYSTVENISLIFLAISISLWARCHGNDSIADIALLAALLHSVAHSLFKSLLFLTAGSVEHSAHSRDLANLGGLGTRMQFTFAAFLLASCAICALPPFNGFASKWFIYQALLNSAISFPAIYERGICLLAIGALGCCGALSLAVFSKVIAVVFLGRPRTAAACNAVEVSPAMFSVPLLFACLCLVIGACTNPLVQTLQRLIPQLHSSSQANSSFDSLQILGCLAVAIAFSYAVIYRKRPAKYITWDCGAGKQIERSQITAESFSQPLAQILAPVLQFDMSVEVKGSDRRHFPESIHVIPKMVSRLETAYKQVGGMLVHTAKVMMKLQAGSIHLYLLYMCVTMAVVVGVGTQLR